MHRLIYTSTAKKLMTERDLQLLLRSARDKNAINEITGLLVYHDGCFLQVLEGEKEALQTCYKRISRDLRHQDCIVMFNDPVVSRMFTQWWMSYRPLEDLNRHQKKQFIGLQALAVRARKSDLIEDKKANALLLAFMSGFRDLDMVG